jgi:RNA polymerase sigma factor (TIGR02999 family)
MSDVTRLIEAAQKGDRQAAADLLPLVYDEMRKLAAAKMAGEAPGHTLNATALVHEAYLRLIDERTFTGHSHFFRAAAEAMRRILIDHARQKRRIRRGGDRKRVALSDVEIAAEAPAQELLALNEALDRFSAKDPIKAELVKLRYFAGLSEEQAAAALGISRATASRYWTYARAWLINALEEKTE